MRIAVAFIYHDHNFQLHFLADYWNIGDKSIDENGSLNEIHKTGSVRWHKYDVNPTTRAKIRAQLTKPLLVMYKRLLGFDIDRIEEGLDTQLSLNSTT